MAADPSTQPDEMEVVPSRVERRRARPRWYTRSFVVIAAVTAVAGGLRFYHLSTPHSYVFDEVYYAKDGCYDAGFPFQDCKLDHPGEQTVTVHPPLGRWIIAGGEAWFGNRPFGWRMASATAGTLSVGLLAILAYLLFQNSLWAGLAGLLLATESLNFVQSRMSMLDIFVALFVVTGLLFLVLDRRWIDRRTPPPPEPPAELPPAEALLDLPPDRPPSPIVRPWRLACGVALGAAAATKWSGGTALVGAAVIALGWERGRRAEAGLASPMWEAVRDEGFGIFLFLVVVPIAVYIATYARWLADHHVDFGQWWALQKSMATFSINLRATHPYASPAWSWILMTRPVSYYYHCFGSTTPRCVQPAEIIGMGNPLIFWASIPALLYAAFAWLRDVAIGAMVRAVAQALAVGAGAVVAFEAGLAALAGVTNYGWTASIAWKGSVVVGVIATGAWFLAILASHGRWQPCFLFLAVAWQYFPWFFASRTNFLFYMTPITPFLVLVDVYALRDLSSVRLGSDRVRALAPLAGFLAVAAVGVFVFFLPVLTGKPISYDMWSARIWFKSWI